MENLSLLTVSSCMDSSAKPDTASAAVDAPLDANVHTDRQMHIRLVSTLTTGGGGSMPALMPCMHAALPPFITAAHHVPLLLPLHAMHADENFTHTRGTG